MGIGAGNHHFTAFQWLAQGFQCHAVEFRQLIQKQHAIMGQADLTGLGAPPAADNGRNRGTVMWLAKGAAAIDAAFFDQAAQGLDHRGFKGFRRRQRRQN